MYKEIVDFIRQLYSSEDNIPLHTPKFDGNEKKYLNECIDSTYVSSVGKFVDRFEEMMEEYTGAKKAVVCVNGTNALHMAMMLVGVEKDDEVITQSLTFIATCNAISYIGAHPVFIDVDRDTMGLSPSAMNEWLIANAEVKGKICYNKKTGRRIKACIPMHTFGHPVHLDELVEVCERFLIEIDALSKNDSDAITFTTEYIDQPINIKEPEVAIGDDQYTYIKNYVCEAENVLYSDNYLDPNTGWQKYLDLDSFVDWYIINEISRNNDAWRWSSTFMNLKMGGKLKMGPIWDFDRSFGNATEFTNFEPEGFWIKDMGWYSRLFLDPVFLSRVKERYLFFYNKKDEIIRYINSDASYLKFSMIENNNKWGMLYNFIDPNYNIWGCYMNEVQSMKDWLIKRMEWLKDALLQ